MSTAQNRPACEIANVIEIRRNRPMVSSLKIAELFERPHNAVLKAIRNELTDEISLGEIDQSDYLDSETRKAKLIAFATRYRTRLIGQEGRG